MVAVGNECALLTMRSYIYDAEQRAVSSDTRSLLLSTYGHTNNGEQSADCSITRDFAMCTYGNHDISHGRNMFMRLIRMA